jgi:hypothetical protein
MDRKTGKCVSKDDSKSLKKRRQMIRKMDILEKNMEALDIKLEKSKEKWVSLQHDQRHFDDKGKSKRPKTSPEYKKAFRTVKSMEKKKHRAAEKYDSLLDKVVMIEHKLRIRSSDP